jgi:WD40 repeat protein
MQTFQAEAESTCRKEIAFTPDGRYLAVGARGLVLLDTTGGPVRTIGAPHWLPEGLAFVRGGTAIAYRAFAQLVVSDLYGTPLWTEDVPLDGHPYVITADPRSNVLYASIRNSRRWEIHSFNAIGLAKRTKFVSGNQFVSRLVLSADGLWLASLGGNLLKVWNVGQKKPPNKPTAKVNIAWSDNITDIALSADGVLLVAVGNCGVWAWNTTSDTEVFRSGKHRRGVRAVACCPTKPLIATGDTAGNVFLWDHTGRVLTRFDWGLGEVNSLAFAPDGLRCAAVDERGKVVVWDVDV